MAQYGFSQYSSTINGIDDVTANGPPGYNIGYANLYGVTQAWTKVTDTGAVGGSSMPNQGGNAYLATDLSLTAVTGTLDAAGAYSDTSSLSGIPTPVGYGIDNPYNIVNFDPGTLTITIPLDNRLTFWDSGTLYDVRTTGQVVAHGVLVNVPEPSSVALLGCGVIGLIGYVIRRKRRA